VEPKRRRFTPLKSTRIATARSLRGNRLLPLGGKGVCSHDRVTNALLASLHGLTVVPNPCAVARSASQSARSSRRMKSRIRASLPLVLGSGAPLTPPFRPALHFGTAPLPLANIQPKRPPAMQAMRVCTDKVHTVTLFSRRRPSRNIAQQFVFKEAGNSQGVAQPRNAMQQHFIRGVKSRQAQLSR